MTSLPPSSTSSTSSAEMRDDSGTSVVANHMPITGNLTEVRAGTISTPFQQMDVRSSYLHATSTHTFSQISSLRARLRRLDDLLDGLRELHQLFQLATDEDIRMNGAEIITLVEVAQSTLTKAKIQLWRYSPCPVHFQPHKRLYFVILRDLKSRRFCFGISLRRRWAVLVFHLSEDFKWGGPHSDDAYTPSWSQSLRSPPRTTPTDCVDTASRRTKPDSHASIGESMPRKYPFLATRVPNMLPALFLRVLPYHYNVDLPRIFTSSERLPAIRRAIVALFASAATQGQAAGHSPVFSGRCILVAGQTSNEATFWNFLYAEDVDVPTARRMSE
ncbi:hypothetical protein PM082_019823 [Marasmius tenuissimus]|nr:hypothetical protein PM082_019823 [Marasmius tenuissimus]